MWGLVVWVPSAALLPERVCEIARGGLYVNSKISAVGDLGRETQGKGPTEEGKWPQRPNISRTSKISAGNTQI